ncbi:MAG TPA: maleylpyruvate isomerase family mycothiol-dependent enzyme, partial [Acidimicrobiia bacterium]|nr:maleylpyruvate isomerase family mycothiol-dependent enzyme [Acidimicrobiia bacterium]
QTEAITDPDAFAAEINQRLGEEAGAYMAAGLDRGRALTPAGVLAWWRTARGSELAAFATVDAEERVLWYGPPMRARSAVTARLMETWAHGQDVTDALGIVRRPTNRLFAIAELGVKTFSWSFTNRGLVVPAERVRVALRGPSGSERVWNDEWSNSITGPVDDFCLVVTQRRHYLDTALVIEGAVARHWMEIAQVFAGPPGPGREPSREPQPATKLASAPTPASPP